MDVIRIGILSFWILAVHGILIFVCAKPLGNVDNSRSKANSSEHPALGYEGHRTNRTRDLLPDLKLLSPDSSTITETDSIEFNITSEIGALTSEGIEQTGEWTTIIIIGLFVATCLIKGLPVLILHLMYGPGPKMPKDNKATVKEVQSIGNSSGVNDASDVTEISSCESECSAQEVCDEIKICTKL